MNSNRLLCNIRNVKRPIIGLVQGRKIVRDELNVEISKRQYLNIMSKCSVYGIVNGDELVVYSGARFDELLEIQNAISAKNTKPVENIKEEVIEKKEEKVEEVKPIIEEPKVEDIIEEPVQPVEDVIPEVVSEPNIVEEKPTIEMVQYTESNEEEAVEENNTEEESVSDNDQNTNKYNNRNNRKNKRKNH